MHESCPGGENARVASATGSPRTSSAKPAAVPRPGFHTLGPSFFKISFISSSMIKVSENIRRARRVRWPAAFSSSPVALRFGFSRSVQSLMEPSHNDPVGAPGQPRQQPRSCRRLRQQLRRSGSSWQLRRSPSTSPATSALPATSVLPQPQLRRSRSTSPATSALPVNLASDFGAPGNLASNFSAPGQPRQELRHM